MDINYELYKVFYHVAKTLSFSDASRELFISQSAVSQSVKTLEKRLDQTLFLRSTKRVRLTKEGEMLYKHIEPAINLIRRGENQILESHSLHGGQLRIGASDTICRYFLVPFLNQFHKQYPAVHIKVKNGTSLQCVEYLKNGAVDIIVVNSPNSRLANISSSIPIHEFYDTFIYSRAYFPELEGHKVSLYEIQQYPILMLDKQSTTSEFIHQLFLKQQLDLAPAIELNSNDLLIDLARIGLGIAFVPDYCTQDSENKGIYSIKLDEPLPARTLTAATSDLVPPSGSVRFFLDLLTKGKLNTEENI